MWDPFREFHDLYQRMGQLWQAAVPGGGGLIGDAWAPPADLPGVKKDDITIELNVGELSAHGEIKETERSGQFDHRVALPQDADEENGTAELTDAC